MSQKITYYFGAGASVHALPLYSEINDRLVAFRNFYERKFDFLQENFKPLADQLIRDVNWFLKRTDSYRTIDDFAEELSNRSDGVSIKDLRKIKGILSSFFLFEQIRKDDDEVFFSDEVFEDIVPPTKIPFDNETARKIQNQIDYRYVGFCQLFLQDINQKIPENIRVISWNYDMQLELAYSRRFDCSMELARQNLQIFPSQVKKPDILKSIVLKLNGTAGTFYNNKVLDHILFRYDVGIKEHIQEILTVYKSCSMIDFADSKWNFHFAYENNPVVKETRDFAKQIIGTTEILVIIGYSFPRLNKNIDREILSQGINLKRIIYQVPLDCYTDRLEMLISIDPKFESIIKPYPNTDEFWYVVP